jgi:hypothetical protein
MRNRTISAARRVGRRRTRCRHARHTPDDRRIPSPDFAQGPNPRFVVTSLPAGAIDARTLYEDVYCARGEVENRIKEQQLDVFADRTSAATMRANQLRLRFASFAYIDLHDELAGILGLCREGGVAAGPMRRRWRK